MVMQMFLENINVTDIREILTVSSKKGRFLKITNRKYYGLSFCLDGQITYTHKDKQFVSDKSNAVFLPKGQTYYLYGDKKGSFPLINFDCTGLDIDTFMVVPIENLEPYLKDFEQMKNLFVFKHNRLKVLSIFYNILNRLYTHKAEKSSPIYDAVKYMENNISDPEITNKTLAAKQGFSEIYFRRLFVSQFGTSPKQYMLDIRIHKAKQLLTDGIHSVTSISEQCGFSSVYHFSRAFKKRVGITPSQYAEQNRITNI